MSVHHAILGPCRGTIEKNMKKGSLFEAIYETADKYPPKIYRIEDLSRLEAENNDFENEEETHPEDEELCEKNLAT